MNVGHSVQPLAGTSNVNLPITSILENYSHILFATGCTLPKLHPSLAQSAHCVPALSVVHWYTSHPSNPGAPPIEKATRISLIGIGNVSLDVARMLLTPVSVLQKYDVPEHVLEVLSRSSVKHVSIIARRGPLEVACTTKELRELVNLPDASMVPIDKQILAEAVANPALTRQQSRILKVMQEGSKNTYGTTEKTWSLDFWRSPMGMSTSHGNGQATLSLAHTMLDPQNPKRAIPTGQSSSMETSLVITSLGFQGDPLISIPSNSSPSNEGSIALYEPNFGHLRTLQNRVLAPGGQVIPNVYASGWAAVGAKGVLATTMMDAYSAADTILSDSINPDALRESAVLTNVRPLTNLRPDLESIPREISDAIEGFGEGRIVEYPQWKKIDDEEQRKGQTIGKERERLTWDDALQLLSS